MRVRSTLIAISGLALVSSLAGAQTYRTTKPVRAVWLRPPSNLTGANSLQSNLENFANAKVTELFLETLWIGQSTGKKGVFNSWFSYDYLDAAIVEAARYGIRIHAWCESGFWQYGTTGAYNFTVNPPGQSEGNPDWVVRGTAGQTGGDQAGWIFANLAHPGVQAKLRRYFVELAGYPGLAGIQTDYHRYPLDDNSADANPAPWSFDTYSRNAFMAIYGSANDPLTKANTTSGSQYANFIKWRRDAITECARQMNLGIDSVDPGLECSADIFAVPVTSKCQDWASWASQGIVDWIIPMAYGPSTFSITNDLTIVKNASAGRRVVAGLYTDTTTNHPAMVDQLNACVSVGVQDWAIFSGPSFTSSANRATHAAAVGNATKQRGDLNNDGYLDANDWQAFRAIYIGTPLPASGSNARLDYNADGVINEADWKLFKAEFFRWRFGERQLIGRREIDAFMKCWRTDQALPTVRHLYDFNADGIVNQRDLVILLAERSCPSDLSDDNLVTDNDFALFAVEYDRLLCPQLPTLCLADQNLDGVVDDADFVLFVGAYASLACP